MFDYPTEFKTWLLAEGKSLLTIVAYIQSISSFAAWYEDSTGQCFNVGDITPLDLNDWKSFLQTVKKMAPATINKNIAGLKKYWSFLLEDKDFLVNPTRKLKMKRSSILTIAPRWLERSEQAKLLHVIEKEKSNWKKIRDLAIAHSMLNGGLRISETSNLDIDDLNFKKGILEVQEGKGGEYGIVSINKDLANALKDWLHIRGKNDDKAVFLSERNRRITDRAIQHQFRKYLDKISLTDATVHCLRHSFCKNLIDAGTPIHIVSQLARHKSIETTRIYTMPGKKELQKAVNSISWNQ